MRKILALMLLSACTAQPSALLPVVAPVVQDMRLTDDTLTIAMSNGTICKADLRAGKGEACGYHYVVAVDAAANPLRKIAQELVLAVGAKNLLTPMAKVTLTDAEGRAQTYVSPKPAPFN